MKILLVETAISGHRLNYIRALLDISQNEFILVVPEKTDLPCKQYVVSNEAGEGNRSFFKYCSWLRAIRKIEKKEKTNITHFLYGDALYRYFGIGLLHYRRKGIITLHFVREGAFQTISLTKLCKRFHKVIVHSDYLLKQLEKTGIQNGQHIEYPLFNKQYTDLQRSRDYYGLNNDNPIILALGGTRSDKGLDVLLDALVHVRAGFQLLIAGAEVSFDHAYIDQHTEKYKESVHTYLKYLTDEEVSMAVSAADIVCLPYKRSFNGASGPLGEGVSQGKCIIGPDHGNLGNTIQVYHLGKTFRSERLEDLAKAIEEILKYGFQPDTIYLEYQKSLDVKIFKAAYDALYTCMK